MYETTSKGCQSKMRKNWSQIWEILLRWYWTPWQRPQERIPTHGWMALRNLQKIMAHVKWTRHTRTSMTGIGRRDQKAQRSGYPRKNILNNIWKVASQWYSMGGFQRTRYLPKQQDVCWWGEHEHCCEAQWCLPSVAHGWWKQMLLHYWSPCQECEG